jgi:peptidoglycan/LPS O-acetylase OafA/YrhL
MSLTSQPARVELAPVFPALDTLRAVGALAVLTTHTSFQSGDYLGNGVWGSLLGRLDIGVAIFFVLSGFLLTRPWFARAALSLPRPGTGRYYWKRVLRIYPVYVVTVVVALALIGENAGGTARDWIRTLLLADVYTQDELPHGLTQMWSLAVEVAFYAVLPLLMLLALGRGVSPRLRTPRVLVVLVALVGTSFWWHLDLGGRLADQSTGLPMTWLPSYLTWFAVGMALALAHVLLQRDGPGRAPLRWLVTLGGLPGVCWAAVAGLMLVASTPLAGPTLLFVASPAESLTKHLLYAAVGGLLVLSGAFGAPGRFQDLMAARLPRHLGHISYGVFCIHLPILHLVMTAGDFELFGGHGLQIWALTLALSLVAAELLYRLVERPANRLRRLPPPWRRRSRTSQANSSATAATTR